MVDDGMNDWNLPCQCSECRELRVADGRDPRTGEKVPVMESVEEDEFKITTSDWRDYEDGSATVTLEMSKSALKFFAQQGLLHVLVHASPFDDSE